MNENPFDPITHTVKITLQRHKWDDLLEDMKRGYHDSITETVTVALDQLLDLRLILSQDEEFKQIYDAWIEEWNARRRDAEDALAMASMSLELDEFWDDPY